MHIWPQSDRFRSSWPSLPTKSTARLAARTGLPGSAEMAAASRTVVLSSWRRRAGKLKRMLVRGQSGRKNSPGSSLSERPLRPLFNVGTAQNHPPVDQSSESPQGSCPPIVRPTRPDEPGQTRCGSLRPDPSTEARSHPPVEPPPPETMLSLTPAVFRQDSRGSSGTCFSRRSPTNRCDRARV